MSDEKSRDQLRGALVEHLSTLVSAAIVMGVSPRDLELIFRDNCHSTSVNNGIRISGLAELERAIASAGAGLLKQTVEQLTQMPCTKTHVDHPTDNSEGC